MMQKNKQQQQTKTNNKKTGEESPNSQGPNLC